MVKKLDIQDFIIRHTTGNLYWKDRQGRYLGCNDELARMLGYDSPEEVIGKTDDELLAKTMAPDQLRRLIEQDQSVMELGVKKIMEEEGIDKNGNTAYYMTEKMPLKDEEGKVIGLVGTSLDITKQKQAEIAKAEFLRNMSHDIMVPFTGILGLSRLLYEEEVDHDKLEKLALLVKSSNRLLDLLKQILELAESGNKQIKLTTFNLKSLIEEAAEIVSSVVKMKGLTLTMDAPDVEIKSDKLRLMRILTNLISNAVKFTHKGNIHISAETFPVLKISVSDTGIGIPKNKLNIIFDKFQKLEESSKSSKFVGSGIGLYLVKQFALDLNGEIHVESKLGKGSTFTFIQKFVKPSS